MGQDAGAWAIEITKYTLHSVNIWLVAECVWMNACSVALTHYNPMDCSPPGSSAHGISHTRKLEWVAISCSRGSSQPRDGTCVSCVLCIGRWFFLPLCHLGSHLCLRNLVFIPCTLPKGTLKNYDWFPLSQVIFVIVVVLEGPVARYGVKNLIDKTPWKSRD